MVDAEFRIQVIAEAAAACPEPEHCRLFPRPSRRLEFPSDEQEEEDDDDEEENAGLHCE